MKRILRAAAVLSLIVSPLAFAADPATEKPAPIAGGTFLGVEVTELASLATGYRATRLLHESVYNDKNQKIGKVDDFIVRPDGKLSYVIVDVGGFLGVGVHHVAIPLSQVSGVKPHVTITGATKEALKAVPQFVYAKS
jgi:sporulation protein YlmC with PRC-barrel domain